MLQLDSTRTKEECNRNGIKSITASIDLQNTWAEYLSSWRYKTELDIYNMTGCTPTCDRISIRLEQMPVVKPKLPPGSFTPLNLEFMYRDGMYTIEKEYYVYGVEDFLADIGGDLGLLLGHSLLSIYSMSTNWISGLFNNIKNRICPRN